MLCATACLHVPDDEQTYKLMCTPRARLSTGRGYAGTCNRYNARDLQDEREEEVMALQAIFGEDDSVECVRPDGSLLRVKLELQGKLPKGVDADAGWLEVYIHQGHYIRVNRLSPFSVILV